MKKLTLLLGIFLAFFSCEEPPHEEKPGQGNITGFVYVGNPAKYIEGLTLKISNEEKYLTVPILESLDFGFYAIEEGEYTLTLYYNSQFVQSKKVTVYKNKTTKVLFTVGYPDLPGYEEEPEKKNFPGFLVIDTKGDDVGWDYMVLGDNDYYFIKEKNSLPQEVIFHSFGKDKDYFISFKEDGLPDKVLTEEGWIFLFNNFNRKKVDLGIISPGGESQVIRGVESDFDWSSLSSKKSSLSKADVIRWTGRAIGAIPCVTSGAAALVSGGVAIPLALWTCGNYLLKMSAEFFDDAGVENGYTHVVASYKFVKTNYDISSSSDPTSLFFSFAHKALEDYADYLDEVEDRSEDIDNIWGFINQRTLIIQPGPEGDDAQVEYFSFSSGSINYYGYPDSTSLTLGKSFISESSRWESEILIRFNIYQIPVNAVIISAEFQVYGRATVNTLGSPEVLLSLINYPWNESTVRWDANPSKIEMYKISFDNPGRDEWRSWVVTSVVKEWFNESIPNYGFCLSATKNDMHGIFYSGDNPDSGKRPRLVINYTSN